MTQTPDETTMPIPQVRMLRVVAATLLASTIASGPSAQTAPERDAILHAMKRATAFMVDKVAYKGGYVWSYLPDMTRRWGEMEARPTMIWIQPPGHAVHGTSLSRCLSRHR